MSTSHTICRTPLNFILAVGIFSAAASTPVRALDLTVKIENAASSTGAVNARLMKNSSEWPRGEGLQRLQMKPERDGGTVLVFRDVPPGQYAVAAFHDENGNGILDRNVVGIPLERYGFSNDARGTLGQPTFDETAVPLDRDTTITLKLR